MDTVRVIHDPDGQSLTVWFGDPTTEASSAEDEHGVIVMKDDAGRVIGVEIIGYGGLCAYPEESFIQTLAIRPDRQGSGLGARLLGALIDEARRDFEWIILDTAPLVLAPDCLMMGRSVDGFLMIVSAHKTSRKEVGEALNIIGPSKLLGMVFNNDDNLLESYGYRTYLSVAQAQQEDLARQD